MVAGDGALLDLRLAVPNGLSHLARHHDGVVVGARAQLASDRVEHGRTFADRRRAPRPPRPRGAVEGVLDVLRRRVGNRAPGLTRRRIDRGERHVSRCLTGTIGSSGRVAAPSRRCYRPLVSLPLPVLDEATLVELADLNHHESYRELTRRAGGVVVDEGGLTFWAGAHPLPVFANAVVRTDPRVPAKDVLVRGHRFFLGHRRGFSVILCAAADADLRPVCDGAGLALAGESPGMALERRLPDAPAPAGVTIHTVATEADAHDFARVSDEAYRTLGMPAGCGLALLGRLAVLRAPHIVSVLASVDGTPAAGAMVILSHGVGGIYWVGTTPAARGRGLGELVTRIVGNAAFDLGARVVVLQASAMGEPIYRRMGYREVTRYPCYVQFTPPSA
jgi:hypothetical protein